MKRICVNCGSSPGFSPEYMGAARSLGSALVEQDIELVYGGADVGLMGEVANTVLQLGGSVTGVIPKSFADKVSHTKLTTLHVVDSMHERKAMMFDLSDAFIALPGGYGTLEEISELLTWAQLGLSNKPCGVINTNGYYDMLFEFLDGAVTEGFMKQIHREMLLVSDSADALICQLGNYTVPSVDKWISTKIGTEQ